MGDKSPAPKICACGCGREVVHPNKQAKYATIACANEARELREKLRERRDSKPGPVVPWEPKTPTAPPPAAPPRSYPNDADRQRWEAWWRSVMALKGRKKKA